MKVIDLLNKIANGEENDLQTEFVFDKKVYNFYKFKNESGYCLDGWLLNQEIQITKSLNDEVEIIEEEQRDIEVCGTLFTKSEYDKLANSEEDKKIEPIEWNTDDDNCQIYFNGAMNYVSRAELELALKINEIIEELNGRN